MEVVCSMKLFGVFTVQLGSQAFTRFRTQKTTSLLAYLAYNSDKVHSREVLAEIFWPDAPNVEAGRASLSTAISSLRTQLEPPGIPYQTILIADRWNTGIAESVRTDVQLFRIAVERAGRANDSERRCALLEEAVGFCRGGLLSGLYDSWIIAQQEAISIELARALRWLVSHYETTGRSAEALAHARRLTEVDTADDEALETLERLIGTTGRTSAGGKKLPVVPLVDGRPGLNRRRLKVASVRSYPPTAPVPPPPEILPLAVPLTHFFGREKELETLDALLWDDTIRLITLTGPGGIGKTHLVQRAVKEHASRRPDLRVCSVNLFPLGSGESLLEMLLVALGGRPKGSTLDVGAVASVVRAPTLLVLDEFEYLMPEGDAPAMLAALLAKAPALTCLITSRQRTGIVGEHLITLEPLPIPQHGEHLSAEQMETLWPSVALFVDRARLIQPDFHLSRRNAGAVAELVAGLEGIPLAIELAASRVRVLTVQQMRERMQQRLNFLQDERRPGARHASLRHSFEWSINLLPTTAQTVFTDLSVFRGGFSAQDYISVLGKQEDEDSLSHLCDASLICGVEEAGQMRFRMLELIRTIASESLPEERRVFLREQHARYFLRVAERSEEERPNRKAERWLEEMESNHQNFLAAMEWAREQGASAAALRLRLASALYQFWLVRGHLSEGRTHLENALAFGDSPPDEEYRAHQATAYNRIGILAMSQGDAEAARRYYEHSLELRADDDLLSRAVTFNNLAILMSQGGDFAAAQDYYERSLVLWQRLGNARYAGTVLANLAAMANDTDDLVRAQELFEQGIALARTNGDGRSLAIRLHNLGEVLYKKADYAGAYQRFRESLWHRRPTKDPHGSAHTLFCVGLCFAADPECAPDLPGNATPDANALLSDALSLMRGVSGSLPRSVQSAIDAYPLPMDDLVQQFPLRPGESFAGRLTSHIEALLGPEPEPDDED